MARRLAAALIILAGWASAARPWPRIQRASAPRSPQPTNSSPPIRPPPRPAKFYPDSPLSMLGDAPNSGVILAPHIAETGKAQRPLEWAQHQSWQLTTDLQDALDKADFLDQLPDTNFYAAGRIEGTASCYDTTPFVVTGGRAKPANLPPNWMGEDVGSGCGVFRLFGKVGTYPSPLKRTTIILPR